MTEAPAIAPVRPRRGSSPKRLRRRHAAERRFRIYGITAIAVAVAILAALLASIATKGAPAFFQSEIALDIFFDPAVIDPDGARSPAALSQANYQALVKGALEARFPDVSGRSAKRQLAGLASGGAGFRLRRMVLADPSLIGTTHNVWVKASDDVDSFVKGTIAREAAEADRRVKDSEIAWIDALRDSGDLRVRFDTTFFTAGDSREPEQAGIWGAVVGSFLTLVVTLGLSFPVAVLAAVYLQEFAARNRWTDLIEVNINNLAAVPSIVFGLLGLAIFLGFFGMPRSAPVVGGLVLALMTLPTIIIAARVALEAVPPSVREAALAVGASKLQVTIHHVLPLAMPGIMTGTIIGMARALGETAPLLMIGMVAFIVDIPGGFTDPATVLPVQIYLWADSPERAFVAKTSAAILVLLAFLVAMNGLAVLLRRRFEQRW
ncbi:MAG TPA: phosphate ABC transporter permease PstA [Kiloniellales bacterium]